jgi:hypothetical protein
MSAPFFILGAQGSGSTLLRLMLDAHPNLAVPPETGFLRLVMAHDWVPFWEFGDRWHRRLGLTDDDRDRRLAEFYGGLFDDYAKAHGAHRWGEKTPYHVWHIDEARRLFPDAVFLAIVRHPYGAVASMSRRFDRDLAKALEHWVGTTREIVRRADELGDSLALVRYEELTRSPEHVLRPTLEWLGEPWDERVLSHHEVSRGSRVVEGGTRADESVDPSRIERWRRWLDDATRAQIDAATHGWAEMLGYGVDPSKALRPLGARDVLALGGELAGLREQFPDLDYSPPARPLRDNLLIPRRVRRKMQRRRRRGPGRAAAEHLPPNVLKRLRAAKRRRDDPDAR